MKLQIEKMVYGGSGLAHLAQDEGANNALTVPFVLPGESVEAQIAEHKSDLGEASLLRILTSSEDRVQPKCAHFGECGGCQYQHAAYPAQLAIKTAVLQETLHHVGLASLPTIQTHTGPQWDYRNRTRLRLEELEGAMRVGYNRRSSNQFLPIHECPILTPLLWRVAQAFLHLAAENSSGRSWAAIATELEFFISGDERKLQMSVFVRKNQPGFAALCEQIKQRIPELVGAGSFLLSTKSSQRQLQKPRPIESWGMGGLSYRAGGDDYWVSRGGFFQVNRYLVDKLIEITTEGRHGQLAWDLYAGVGLFSRQLAKQFQQVVAVEIAGNDLANSFRGPGKASVQATTVEFLRNAVVQRERPELIVMDPPRAGVGAEVCSLLARLSAPEIVYVSCDPVTLARDLKLLVGTGYNVIDLHLIDLFPQTFHLETVVVLRK